MEAGEGGMIEWLTVFAAVVLLDFIWVYCVAAVAEKRLWPAAFSSAAWFIVAGFVTIEYVNNPILLSAAAMGAFIGTIFAILWEKR
jgi:hypothetical protein